MDISCDDIKKVDEYMESYINAWPFSGCVVVAAKGRELYKRCFGKACIEWDIPNTPETRFRIYSTTKQITAVAVLMLRERGLIKLEDRIAKYFPECPRLDPRITVHHLLSQTSGLKAFDTSEPFARLAPLSLERAEMLNLINEQPMLFEPGEGWHYSNSGYYLLGVMIEKLSGLSYGEYLKNEMFEPLGMDNTGIDYSSNILAQSAFGYTLRGREIKRCKYQCAENYFSGGSLYSTVGDLLKWDRVIYGEALISRESAELMLTPIRNNYGYGVFVKEKFGEKWQYHGGSSFGYKTMFDQYLTSRLCIIILTNYDFAQISIMKDDLAAILYGNKFRKIVKPERSALPSAHFDQYTGRYENEEKNLYFDIKKDGEKFFIRHQHGDIWEIYPGISDVFYTECADVEYKIEQGEGNDILINGFRLSRK